MSKEKLGQEPAFPCEEIDEKNSKRGNQIKVLKGGISKRFYAACMAMQGIIAATRQDDIYPTAENISELSYKYADEMLKQENL